MAWYEDLAPCDYFGGECASCLRAVGWLERGRPFATGRVDPAVYVRLVELLKEPWQPGLFMGFHRCDLCVYEGMSGRRNLFVPAGGVAFVAPELVAHYMNAHGYRPPDEFCTAVLACPPMRSMPYLKAMLTAARPLVQGSGVEGGRRMKITIETTVAAPVEAVWRAWTTPDDIKQWNAASDDWHTTAATVDLRPGGTFTSRMEAKDGSFGFDFTGTYTRVVPHELIEYTMTDGRAVTVAFAPAAGGVTVRETFDAEGTHTPEQQRAGWQAILDRFARHVEASR